MTLRWAEGLEDMTSLSNLGQYFEGYSINNRSTQNMAFSSTLGRRGSSCIYWPASAYGAEYVEKYWPDPRQEGWKYYVGFAIYTDYINTNGVQIMLGYFPGANNAAFGIYLDSDWSVRWYGVLNSTSHEQLGSGPTLMQDTWYYFEFGCYNHATAGEYWGRINDTQEFHWGPGDNVSQSFYPTQYPNAVRFYVGSYSAWRFDDFYFADDQGSYNNGFLGSVRVDSIRPNGAGNYSQMTPSAGSNYQCVDDPHYDDSDYVEADTDGEKDTYAFPDVPTDLDDSNIKGVLVGGQSKRTEENPNVKIRHMVRKGSTDYYGSAGDDLGDTDDFNYHIFERDPSDSSAWTQAKINASEFGMELEKT